MIFGGKGGGNTKTGLVFEGTTDLSEFLNSQKVIKFKMATYFIMKN